MTVSVETESAPSAAQMHAWRQLWNLLLLDNPAPAQSQEASATNNAQAEDVGSENR